MKQKPSILILIDWFFPAYKAGGPVRSCVNIAHLLEDEYRVFVLTSDRDLGDKEAFESIPLDTWTSFSKQVKVYYISQQNTTYSQVISLIQSVNPDFLYLNGMFSIPFTIWPLWGALRNKLKTRIVLAPRGMLKKSALAYKPLKKKVFLTLFHLIKLPRLITFHTTDNQEFLDVRHRFKQIKGLHQIPIPPPSDLKPWSPSSKKTGTVKVFFSGRIHPIKHLDYLLRVLQDVDEQVQLDIIGPIEDHDYWHTCQQLINELPAHIHVNYLGQLPHPQLIETIREYHFLALPTQGENFGHAIFEAFLAGKPALLSDQTPWRDLMDQKAGWDLPLRDLDKFTHVLNLMAGMDQETYNLWSKSSWKYAKTYIQNSDLKSKYRALFS